LNASFDRFSAASLAGYSYSFTSFMDGVWMCPKEAVIVFCFLLVNLRAELVLLTMATHLALFPSANSEEFALT
jgi:hypothetical protein